MSARQSTTQRRCPSRSKRDTAAEERDTRNGEHRQQAASEHQQTDPLPPPDLDTLQWRTLLACAEVVSLDRVRDAMGKGLEPMMGLLRSVTLHHLDSTHAVAGY